MTNNPKFTVQLLDKIGAPLTVAIDWVHLGGGDAQVDAEVDVAQIMAQLLGCVTQMSTKLYNMLQIQEAEDQADSTRLALAALVAPLVADFYRQHKQVPSEADIGRIEKSLEAVVSFGENFTPAADHQSRLQTIDHDVVLFDKDQPSLVMMQAMVPVINAVEEFSFGQERRKLVQDIATKLENYATEISQKTGGGDKLKELMTFKALATLYASCHMAEVSHMARGDDVERGEPSLDPVWETFESKVAMVEALMGVKEAAAVASRQAPAPEEDSSPAPEEVEATSVAPQEAAPATATGGPMGFFKKTPEGDSASPAETPATVETIPPVEGTQAEPAPSAVPKDKPENKTENKAENKAEEASETPSSPMGFFKPGAEKTESDEA